MGFQVKSSGIFSGMRFAAVVAAFLIGLVTGVAASPEANFPSEENSKRREIVFESH